MKYIHHYLEYLLLRTIIFLINLFPLSTVLQWAEWIGPCLQKILKSKNQIALENLRQAFGTEKSEEEIRRIARDSFVNLVKLAFEFIRIPRLAADPEQYIRFVHQENVWKALEKGRGVILIVSHFGNWELMAVRSAKEGLPMHAVARPLKNPFVYEYVKKLRGSTGLVSVNKKGAARESLRILKANKVICFLIDQREREGGVAVPFFGRPALTTTLPALLAMKRDVPVIPCFHYRNSNGTTTLVPQEPLALIRTGDEEGDVIRNTHLFMSVIEKEVRKDPANWLWMHRRWRL